MDNETEAASWYVPCDDELSEEVASWCVGGETDLQMEGAPWGGSDAFGPAPSWHAPQSFGDAQWGFNNNPDFDYDLDFEGAGATQRWQWLPDEFAASMQAAPRGSGGASSSTSRSGNGSLDHKNVRRTVDFAAEYASREDIQVVTTLMLRSMPRNFSRRKLFALLDDNGFKDRYDFLYLPLDSSTHCSVGYAFVNFLDPDSAAEFKTMMYGYTFPGFPYNDPRDSRKRAMHISTAHLQGVERNLEHLRMSAVLTSNPAARPWFKHLDENPKENVFFEESPEMMLSFMNSAQWWTPEEAQQALEEPLSASVAPAASGELDADWRVPPPPGLDEEEDLDLEAARRAAEAVLAVCWRQPSPLYPQGERLLIILERILGMALRLPESALRCPYEVHLPPHLSRCLNFLAVAAGSQLASSGLSRQGDASLQALPRALMEMRDTSNVRIERLGDIVDTKPMDIQDWPALGGFPKAAEKFSRPVKSSSKIIRKAPAKDSPLMGLSSPTPSWLVPLPALPPPVEFDEKGEARPYHDFALFAKADFTREVAGTATALV
jgi:hypothetical protein